MVTEKMIEAARDKFKELAGIQIYLPGEGTLDDFEQGRYDALVAALEAALSTDAEPVAYRPSYQQIKDTVQSNINRMHSAGESHLMMARWLSADLDKLYPPQPAPSVAVKALEDAVRKELEGIDKEETYDSKGWWETSTGSSFGAEKLNAVLLLIRSALSAQVQDVAELSPADYMRRHDAAIAAYEANTPSDYRYSALALRKAVDAAFEVAAAPAAKLEEKP